jgi:hypothetical protein
MRRVIGIVLFAACFLIGDAVHATTYYVDYVGGADTNSGTAKTSAWRLAPGMVGCSATCAATAIHGGDSIILKGGVTWPNAALGWSPTAWNTTGPNTYIGVDTTWFSGSVWTRPVLDGGGAHLAGNNNTMLAVGSGVTIDNLEFKGLYWDSTDQTFCQGVFVCQNAVGVNTEIKNCYFHGWSHGTVANGTYDRFLIDGDTHTPSQNTGSSFHDNVVDGSDGDQHSGGAIFGGPPLIYNNVIRYVSNGMIVNGALIIHDNLTEFVNPSYDGVAHENCMEENAGTGLIYYNNICRHTTAVNLWFAPNPGTTDYIFNNVSYDTDPNNGNVLNLAHPVVNNGCAAASNPSYCAQEGGFVVINNTIECGPDSNPAGACFGVDATATGMSIMKNNHAITSGATMSPCGSNCSQGNNLVESKSTANAQSYTSAETYSFSPTLATSPTVGTGITILSICATITTVNAAAGIACLSDTTYAVGYNSTSHVVITPNRATNSRILPFGIGAYQYSASTAQQPAPASGLAGTGH